MAEDRDEITGQVISSDSGLNKGFGMEIANGLSVNRFFATMRDVVNDELERYVPNLVNDALENPVGSYQKSQKVLNTKLDEISKDTKAIRVDTTYIRQAIDRLEKKSEDSGWFDGILAGLMGFGAASFLRGRGKGGRGARTTTAPPPKVAKKTKGDRDPPPIKEKTTDKTSKTADKENKKKLLERANNPNSNEPHRRIGTGAGVGLKGSTGISRVGVTAGITTMGVDFFQRDQAGMNIYRNAAGVLGGAGAAWAGAKAGGALGGLIGGPWGAAIGGVGGGIGGYVFGQEAIDDLTAQFFTEDGQIKIPDEIKQQADDLTNELNRIQKNIGESYEEHISSPIRKFNEDIDLPESMKAKSLWIAIYYHPRGSEYNNEIVVIQNIRPSSKSSKYAKDYVYDVTIVSGPFSSSSEKHLNNVPSKYLRRIEHVSPAVFTQRVKLRNRKIRNDAAPFEQQSMSGGSGKDTLVGGKGTDDLGRERSNLVNTFTPGSLFSPTELARSGIEDVRRSLAGGHTLGPMGSSRGSYTGGSGAGYSGTGGDTDMPIPELTPKQKKIMDKIRTGSVLSGNDTRFLNTLSEEELASIGIKKSGGHSGLPIAYTSIAKKFTDEEIEKHALSMRKKQYRPEYKLGDDDLSDAVINTIAGEALANNQESIDAVINNMMNRVGTQGWENLRQVARAPSQYEGYRVASAAEKKNIQDRIRAIASGEVEDKTKGSDVFRANWYLQGEGKGKTFYRMAQSQGYNNVGGNVFANDPSLPDGPNKSFDEPIVSSDATGPITEKEREAARVALQQKRAKELDQQTAQIIASKNKSSDPIKKSNPAANLKGVDSKLMEVMNAAKEDLPEGYTVEAISGKNSRSTGTKNHPSGLAMDVIIRDKNGKAIPHNKNSSGWKYYEMLYRSVHIRGQKMFPNDKFIWGGAWISSSAGRGDPMHYQIVKKGVGSQTSGRYSFEEGLNKNHPFYKEGGQLSPEEREQFDTIVRENIEKELNFERFATDETRRVTVDELKQEIAADPISLPGYEAFLGDYNPEKVKEELDKTNEELKKKTDEISSLKKDIDSIKDSKHEEPTSQDMKTTDHNINSSAPISPSVNKAQKQVNNIPVNDPLSQESII